MMNKNGQTTYKTIRDINIGQVQNPQPLRISPIERSSQQISPVSTIEANNRANPNNWNQRHNQPFNFSIQNMMPVDQNNNNLNPAQVLQQQNRLYQQNQMNQNNARVNPISISQVNPNNRNYRPPEPNFNIAPNPSGAPQNNLQNNNNPSPRLRNNFVENQPVNGNQLNSNNQNPQNNQLNLLQMINSQNSNNNNLSGQPNLYQQNLNPNVNHNSNNNNNNNNPPPPPPQNNFNSNNQISYDQNWQLKFQQQQYQNSLRNQQNMHLQAHRAQIQQQQNQQILQRGPAAAGMQQQNPPVANLSHNPLVQSNMPVPPPMPPHNIPVYDKSYPSDSNSDSENERDGLRIFLKLIKSLYSNCRHEELQKTSAVMC